MVSGLGAATADALYGAIAAFGLTTISAFLVSEQAWIRVVGGAFLLLLGVRIFRASPPGTDVTPDSPKLIHDYASTFVITLSNPMTIISFAAVFAGLGLAGTGGDTGTAPELVAGVFSGSCVWWVVLSAGVGAFKGRLASGGVRWVNRLSSVIIIAFGAIAITSAMVP